VAHACETASWEAAQGQLSQGIQKTLYQPMVGQGGVCLSSQAMWEAKIEGNHSSRPAWAKVCETPSQQKKAGCSDTHLSSIDRSLK
jgi:hypothetical protein